MVSLPWHRLHAHAHLPMVRGGQIDDQIRLAEAVEQPALRVQQRERGDKFVPQERAGGVRAAAAWRLGPRPTWRRLSFHAVTQVVLEVAKRLAEVMETRGERRCLELIRGEPGARPGGKPRSSHSVSARCVRRSTHNPVKVS